MAFAEAEFLAGWVALDWLRDPALALPHFERLHAGVSSPISLARGAYWAGEAEARAGRSAAAAAWWRRAAVHGETFYGQMAIARLGGAPAVVGNPAPPASPTAAARPFGSWSWSGVIEQLAALERPRPGVPVLRRSSPARARRGGLAPDRRPGHAPGAGPTSGSGPPSWRAATAMCWPDHLFPLLDGLELGPAGEAALVLGLMRQESSFWTRAVSRVGARGLMQLMPATAKQTAGELGLDYSLSRLTDDPAYNVTLGRVFLIDHGGPLRRLPAAGAGGLQRRAEPGRPVARRVRRPARPGGGGDRLDRDDPLLRDAQLRPSACWRPPTSTARSWALPPESLPALFTLARGPRDRLASPDASGDRPTGQGTGAANGRLRGDRSLRLRRLRHALRRAFGRRRRGGGPGREEAAAVAALAAEAARIHLAAQP